MSDPMAAPHRQQQLYWKQFVQLKADSIAIRLYRNDRAKWTTRLGVIRGVASSGSIAAWAIWKELSFVWGAIIAVSQVVDALKDVFPFVKQHKAAADLTRYLESLLIEVQFEWENIFASPPSNPVIMDKRQKIMEMQLKLERKHFPDGLEMPPKLFTLAESEAKAYFQMTYGSSV
ncbi:hypothetical protein [Nitrospirillum sp. BR 11828]|uniref:hypothetical protein n=1 Tax=Nitrospirillum sp. BR 11828 TaxID=3104325 RepID=UPI002ACA1172|nr:hypothetical protein [Nitrospirillum sp. BR 11828]MDZ5650754.1 hypothetical protein [Nitrospirillum sp. BR 11828]